MVKMASWQRMQPRVSPTASAICTVMATNENDSAETRCNTRSNISTRTKTETIVREIGVKDGRQYLSYGLLDHPVNNGWDTQLAFTAIRFIYLNTPDG